MDNDEILALFNRSDWDEVDEPTVHSATRACKEIVGATPDAGWIEQSASFGCWFVAGHGTLVHVTGSPGDWTVCSQWPRWVSTQVQLTGTPNRPTFGVGLVLKPAEGDEVKMNGAGQAAHYLLAFLRHHLSKFGSE